MVIYHRDVAVEMETNNSARNIVTKLLNLFSDISQKGITDHRPLPFILLVLDHRFNFPGQHNGWPEGLPARAVGHYLSLQNPLLGKLYRQFRHPLCLLCLPVHLLSDIFLLKREWNRPGIKGEGLSLPLYSRVISLDLTTQIEKDHGALEHW